MTLADAHIKRALRKLGLHHRHRSATGHGSSNSHNVLVILGEFHKSLTKHVLELERLSSARALDALACVLIKLSWSMPGSWVFFGRLITLALHSVEVNELGTCHILDIPEGLNKLFHIVTVEGAKVTYVESLEYILLTSEQRLHGVVETQHHALAAIANDVMLAHELIGLVAEIVVALRCGELGHVFTQRTHWSVNRHVVVVEHYEQVVLVNRRIIDALKCQAATNRGIANHRHHAAVGVGLQLAGDRHSQRCRYGVAGMTSLEGVVLALAGIGESTQTTFLAVGREAVATSSQNLVWISLMSHVPHQAVVGSVEHIVQRHSNLHGTHTRSEVPRVLAQLMHDELAQLGTHSGQLIHIQLLQVGWRINLCQ